jgi:hydroxypyruvate isomerase
MAKIGICIEPCFGELDYKSRIQSVAKIGYKYYDLWFHNFGFTGSALTNEKKDFDMIAEMNEKYGLVTTSFVHTHPDGGIQYDLLNKKHRQQILDSYDEILPLAKKINCKGLVSGSGNIDPSIPDNEAKAAIIETLKESAKIVEKEGITILLEPWNNKVDHPDNWLNDPALGVEIIKAVGSDNVKLLYDIYHMQIMAGNHTDFIKENLRYIGHFQMASVPGRNEPIDNEVNYRFIIKEAEKLGYEGVFGLEYWPKEDPELSLKKCFDYFHGN